jgi:hypothetical protein
LLTQVWESEEAAEVLPSDLIKRYADHTDELFTLYMKNISAGGTWIGKTLSSGRFRSKLPIAVITRATIKWNWLLRFWKYVPTSEEGLDGNEGLIYTKGWRSSYNSNGTFSLWKDFESVKQFVSKQHKEAIKKHANMNGIQKSCFQDFNL